MPPRPSRDVISKGPTLDNGGTAIIASDYKTKSFYLGGRVTAPVTLAQIVRDFNSVHGRVTLLNTVALGAPARYDRRYSVWTVLICNRRKTGLVSHFGTGEQPAAMVNALMDRSKDGCSDRNTN